MTDKTQADQFAELLAPLLSRIDAAEQSAEAARKEAVGARDRYLETSAQDVRDRLRAGLAGQIVANSDLPFTDPALIFPAGLNGCRTVVINALGLADLIMAEAANLQPASMVGLVGRDAALERRLVELEKTCSTRALVDAIAGDFERNKAVLVRAIEQVAERLSGLETSAITLSERDTFEPRVEQLEAKVSALAAAELERHDREQQATVDPRPKGSKR